MPGIQFHSYRVHVSGGYAYLADYEAGVQIIDISDPRQPTLAGNIPAAANVREVRVVDGLAYVADGTAGLQIVDVTDPADPVFLAAYDTAGFSEGLRVLDDYAYLAEQAGFQVVDVSQPFSYVYEEYSMPRRVRLEVVDSSGNTAQATRDVWGVPYNNPPVLSSVTATEIGFSALATDPDYGTSWDGLLEYRRDFDADGSWDTRYEQSPDSVSPPGYDGTDVVCEVRDLFNATARFTLKMTDNPPVADAGPDQTAAVNEMVVCDGSGSSDDLGIVLYEWDFESDGTWDAFGETASHAYGAAGVFTLKIRVTDGSGQTGIDSAFATVIAGNDSPVAAAGPDRTAAVREDIPFDGSGSFDPDGAVTGYQWDFGDGKTGNGISVTHAYKKAGTYTVSLTVIDDQGVTSPPDTARVTVIR